MPLEAVNAGSHQRTFLEWCQQRSQITSAQAHTVQMMMEAVQASDCVEASEKLETSVALSFMKKGLQDLAPLGSLTQLPNLTLVGNPIQSLTPLTRLEKLQYLMVADAGLKDVTPLGKISSLQTVILDFNQIEDLSSLQSLGNLRSLLALHNPLQSKRCPVKPSRVCVFDDDGAELMTKARQADEAGDFALARVDLGKAIELYRRQDDPLRLARVINQLADLDFKQGRYPQAIEGYEQAIALRRELEDIAGIGVSLVQQAAAFEQLGLFDKAEERLETAADNAERQWKLGIPLEGGLYELPKDTAALYRNLAKVQNRLGKPEEAMMSLRRSLKNYDLLPDGYPGKRVGYQTSLLVLGQTRQKLGFFGGARKTYQQALTLAEANDDAEGKAAILAEIGLLQLDSQQLRVSSDYFSGQRRNYSNR